MGWSSYQKLESSSSVSPRLETRMPNESVRLAIARTVCHLASWRFSRAYGRGRHSFQDQFERYSESVQER